MKKLLAATGFLWASLGAGAQDITGEWTGLLKVPAQQLRIVFHITQTDTGYSAVMDSPDQGVRGIPVASTRFDQGRLTLELNQPTIEYSGEWKDSLITGIFRQAGMSFPLEMRRGAGSGSTALRRPQEPVRPYPYAEEEVKFDNKDAGVTLAGTLSLPPGKGSFPAVVLITGSGPQNRDEEIFGHKPFLVIADALTRAGVAVLRYDDRGVGKSTGDFGSATTADFAGDVRAAVAWLRARKDIDPRRIGLIGHSEGGAIAPLVAAGDKRIRFIVLLAGPGVSGEEIMLSQEQGIARVAGAGPEAIREMVAVNRGAMDIVVHDSLRMEHRDSIRRRMEEYFAEKSKEYPALQANPAMNKRAIDQLTSPWMEWFLAYDPAPVLERVHCPVLAMAGAKDLQVAPEENLAAIGRALAQGGNNQFESKEFPGLNHLFQECKTGLPAEYGSIEQTFSPAALAFLVSWVVKH